MANAITSATHRLGFMYSPPLIKKSCMSLYVYEGKKFDMKVLHIQEMCRTW
ncbi:hypothetical protein CHCC20335_0477 [Bacillus paralicheniformis]|nr:hypothetical protein CHCC20335_0477 [Bacillus paralicheniformis]